MSKDLHTYGKKTHNVLLIESKGIIQPLKPWFWKHPLDDFPNPSQDLQALISSSQNGQHLGIVSAYEGNQARANQQLTKSIW